MLHPLKCPGYATVVTWGPPLWGRQHYASHPVCLFVPGPQLTQKAESRATFKLSRGDPRDCHVMNNWQRNWEVNLKGSWEKSENHFWCTSSQKNASIYVNRKPGDPIPCCTFCPIRPVGYSGFRRGPSRLRSPSSARQLTLEMYVFYVSSQCPYESCR